MEMEDIKDLKSLRIETKRVKGLVDSNPNENNYFKLFQLLNKFPSFQQIPPLCLLCLEEHKTINSHTIPKAIFQRMCEGLRNESFLQFEGDVAQGKKSPVDLTFRLLCYNCDNYFSKCEAVFIRDFWSLVSSETDAVLLCTEEIQTCMAVIIFRQMLCHDHLNKEQMCFSKFLELREWLLQYVHESLSPFPRSLRIHFYFPPQTSIVEGYPFFNRYVNGAADSYFDSGCYVVHCFPLYLILSYHNSLVVPGTLFTPFTTVAIPALKNRIWVESIKASALQLSCKADEKAQQISHEELERQQKGKGPTNSFSDKWNDIFEAENGFHLYGLPKGYSIERERCLSDVRLPDAHQLLQGGRIKMDSFDAHIYLCLSNTLQLYCLTSLFVNQSYILEFVFLFDIPPGPCVWSAINLRLHPDTP